MTIAKYGKSYDTSNGSEQADERSTRRVQGDGQAAQERWQDDGGPSNDLPMVAAFAGELISKPAWSVLSLHDLNEAIRRAQQGDAKVHLRQEAERIERRRVQAIRIAGGKAAADRDCFRNEWEHI